MVALYVLRHTMHSNYQTIVRYRDPQNEQSEDNDNHDNESQHMSLLYQKKVGCACDGKFFCEKAAMTPAIWTVKATTEVPIQDT